MKRILVPTDFSPTAERAFRFALELVAKSAGTIILYHVHKPVTKEFVGTKDERDMYNKQMEINLIKKMQRLKKKVLNGNESVSVSTVLGRAPVIDNILGFAEGNRIELIIMGTQGATGIRKTIIGTVASKIATLADIPVILIPEKYTLKMPKHIVFASNYTKSDRQVLSILLSLAQHFKSLVTVLHLRNAYLSDQDKLKVKKDFDLYSFALQREFNQFKIKFLLLDTDTVMDTLESLNDKLPYDLITMVRRKKGFYEKFFVGSFTKNMAYVTSHPLMIIPEEAEFTGALIEQKKAEKLADPLKTKLKVVKIIKKK